MRLKKVTITGFKSFKDRTQISFEGPILCVVGPNGCGKSNLVDAFRWVLGEQSSQLRGASAEDVLFHGVEGVAAANKAEVSLHFIGCKKSLGFDSDEIEITRKLTREKDSEYLINRQSCRLKEIHQLLSQTGLGKSSAIIEQGKLDQLIYLSPTERGKIFLQASGVDHVLQRKKETDNKLQEIQIHYDRILDTLELKKRDLQHLQKQAKIATHFQEIKKEIEEIEKVLSYLDFQSSIEKKNQLQIILAKLESALEKNRIELGEKKILREKKEGYLLELQHKQENIQELLWKKISQTKVLEERGKRLDLDQKNLVASHEKRKQQKIQLKKQLEEQEKQKNFLQEKSILLVQSKKDSTTLLQERQKRLSLLEEEYQLLEKEREQMHKHLLTLLEQKRILSLRLNESKLTLETHTKQLGKITESLEKEQKDLEIKERVQAEKIQICKQLLDEDLALQKQLLALQEQKESAYGKLLPLQKELSALQEEMQQLTIQKATLIQFLESEEGFSRGAKMFLEEAKKKNSPLYQKISRLFELLSFEEGKEQLAITSLYRYLDTVVVESYEDTVHLIAFAKEQKIDSFSFICKENLQRQPKGEVVKLFSAENIGQKLSGKLGLEDAFLQAFSKKTSSFVSKDGYFVDESGVVFFIAKNCIQTTLPIRKKELIKVESSLEKLQSKEKKDQYVIEELETLTRDLQKQIEQIQTKRHKVQMSHVGENMHLQSAKKHLQEALSKIEQETLQKAQLTHAILETQNKVRKIAEEEKEIEKNIQEKNDLKFARTLEEKKKELRLLQSDFFEKQKEDHILQQQEKETILALSRIDEKFSELLIDLEKIEDELNRFSPQNEEMLIDKQKREEQMISLNKEIGIEEAKKQHLIEEKKVISHTNAQLNKELEKQTLELFELEQKKKEQQLQYELFDEKTKKGISLVVSTFIGQDPKVLKEKVTQLKMQLKDENKINFASIDEVKEKQKEFSEIDAQLEDIQAAKKDLESALALLDQESHERFNEHFALVKNEFKKNFSQLFGGGKADLRLRTTTDIFSCGIEILAEPPGKKMQRLTLLSGGEKSLTALALLFSFFAVRPGPFCLLDEVDAPLDEANVHRLTSLLKEYGQNTQFVVITHNKKTMESANLLLGVSMEQKGISRILSVSFEKEFILSEYGGEK